ncbi:hypothetical protein GR197_03875 [Rhizobium phaseoli]|jgi:hypothetical protein|uniref:Uncharacterized protein n=1 Tax=Rhizobium phaseoli TaxID=396 RepID=A0A7K3U7L3_9HYPH|nr:hypothetical protein [Rhizobium phaseoli]NEJ69677.1 hypothetical protein [Rhizobium phaseoli]
MKLDFHSWLQRTINRLLEPKVREPANASSLRDNQLFSRDEERDRSAREYELHYWGALPGLWY